MAEHGTLASQSEREAPFEPVVAAAARASEAHRHEILVAISNPDTVAGLISLGARLCRPGDLVVAVKIVPVARSASLPAAQGEALIARRFRDLMQRAVAHGEEAGVAVEPVLQAAYDVPSGIIQVANERSRDVRLLLLGWPGSVRHGLIATDIGRRVMREAACNVAIFLNRGLGDPQQVLVPVGGGPHARLGLRLAADLVGNGAADLIALRVTREGSADSPSGQAALGRLLHEELEDNHRHLAITARTIRAESVVAGIVGQAALGCDLLVVGASEEGLLRNWLFGSIPGGVARAAPCSVLLVHKREPSSLSRIRRVVRRILGSRPRLWRGEES